MLRRYSQMTSLAVIAMLATGVTAMACPFCKAPSLTLAERVDQSDAVVLVKWKKGTKSDGRLPGSTTYEIIKVHKGSQATLKRGKDIVLTRFRPGKPGELFMLLGTRTVNVDWQSPMEVSEASFSYIENFPNVKSPTAKRLEYYMKYLEFPDDLVSNDAYAEFANAPFKDIAKTKKLMPRERLRKWVVSEDTAPTRLGLYGLMLGLCGNADDAKLMEKTILADDTGYRLGIVGVMSGYLMLRGEEGLKILEDAKMKPPADKVPFSETYAAMQAVGFMWDFAPNVIKKDRLKKSMRVMLTRPESVDLVIANLARWKDWEVQDRLVKLYDEKDFDIPAVKRAIVHFLLVCAKDVKAGTPASKLPEHVVRAKANIEMLRKKDPKTVRNSERFFF